MNRPELTAVNYYDIFPFNHGGALGIRGLYKALSEWFDINIITLVTKDLYPDEVAISNHIKVFPVCLPKKVIDARKEMCREYGINQDSVAAYDLVTILRYHKDSEIVEHIQKITENSLVVIAEHAYSWRIVKSACPNKHLWYRANNVEYDYKHKWNQDVYPYSLLHYIYEIEKECCEQCERILAVSQLDIDRFMELYEYPGNLRRKFIDIRSGYDTNNLKTVMPSQRKKISSKYNNFGFFITSYTSYGQIAVENCIAIAKELSDIQIIIAGSIYRAFKEVVPPENVVFVGIISDEEKTYYLQHCDFALNLLEDGAGINIKMFEYFAFGIPVITTVHGARGISVTDEEDCILTEKEHYVDDIRRFCNMPISVREQISQNALKLLMKEYDWRNLGFKIAKEVGNICKLSIFESALPLEEIALYEFEEKVSYLPQKSFYIRCAGEYGKNCLKFLRSKGLEPKAFIDENCIGLEREGIPVISLKQFLDERIEEEVIVAVSPVHMIDITAELITMGVSFKNISLSWDIKGQKIIRLFDFRGCLPQYYSTNKWRENILKKSHNTK